MSKDQNTRTIQAQFVEEGDFLPGLDDGYVFEDPEAGADLRYGRYNHSLGGNGYVLISFHTNDGDEAYLVVPETQPVTVRRPSGDFDNVEEDE